MSALDPKRTCPLQGRKFSRYHRLVWLGAPVGGRAVRDGAVPVRGARRRVALDLGGGAGAAGGADRRVVGGVVGASSSPSTTCCRLCEYAMSAAQARRGRGAPIY